MAEQSNQDSDQARFSFSYNAFKEADGCMLVVAKMHVPFSQLQTNIVVSDVEGQVNALFTSLTWMASVFHQIDDVKKFREQMDNLESRLNGGL